MKVYTIGYQGVDLEHYINVLKREGVSIIADVRETPWSHKTAFCKNALARELSKAGIEYVHVKSAGNPKENRKTAPNLPECLRRYKTFLKSNPQGITDLLGLIHNAAARNKSICLTCFEKDANDCHRSILISALGTHLEIKSVHL